MKRNQSFAMAAFLTASSAVASAPAQNPEALGFFRSSVKATERQLASVQSGKPLVLK
ncbi:MAG: hypothetical protein HY646_08880 [Acidobacteria bacterium]|nr:hypothetical protein [Acidobacteriota bacterium]